MYILIILIGTQLQVPSLYISYYVTTKLNTKIEISYQYPLQAGSKTVKMKSMLNSKIIPAPTGTC